MTGSLMPEQPVNVTPDPWPVPIAEKPTPAKAVVAGATALTTGLVTAIGDGRVTVVEIILMALGAIIAVASVWAVSNKPEAFRS